jgi:hypothetical protein
MYADDATGELLLFSQQSPQASYGNGIVLRHVSSGAPCEKRLSFLNISYVCPEPVLVK